MKRSGGKPDESLAHELFGVIETEQGFAHISDGITVLTRDEILGIARASLKHHRKCVLLLEDFLRNRDSRKAPDLQGAYRMKTPKQLDAIVDAVLSYKPKPKSKAGKRREHRTKREAEPT